VKKKEKPLPIEIIRDDHSIAISWLEGKPLEVANVSEDIERIVKELEAVAAISSTSV
jgi:hypothetical protein